MMKKLLANKKSILAILGLLVVVCAIIVLTRSCGAKGDSTKDTDIKDGQSEETLYNDDGLDVVEQDEHKPEESTSAGGSWEKPAKEPAEKPTFEGNNKGNANNSGEDIMTDDKDWGPIF